MPTVALTTLGCKVNLYETERIRAGFESYGFAVVGENDRADVYVVNTCSVTGVAEAKSRKLVRKLARQNPGAVVVVTGCDVEMARMVGRAFPEAAITVPNASKLDIPRLVIEHTPQLRQGHGSTGDLTPQLAPRRTRAFIKVQDGCDMFCSYCSVPLTRGEVRSRPPGEVLDEVRAAAASGHREIVITGVLVGAYGRDGSTHGADLADLVEAICAVPGVERVRLSSIEPTQVTNRLLAVVSRLPQFCPHLHLPLQSGDDGVLAAMNRPYTREFYREICRRAGRAMPDIGITTDVLVGFPGESEEAHANTMALMRDIGFARVHVFRYSPRPMTPAASLSGMVPDAVKSERAAAITALARELQAEFVRHRLGRTLPVLVEPASAGRMELAGYTSNYIRVSFMGDPSLVGQVASVRLTKPTASGAHGEIVCGMDPSDRATTSG
jgi:threonylcarbamoyladenosine tRNA methylthiotransferase MtaB